MYNAAMRYIFLAIFVFLAAQPLQASPCDMHDAQGTSQAQHGDMNDMDCCGHDSIPPSDNCDPLSHCGACTAGVVTVDFDSTIAVFATNPRLHLLDTGEPLSRFNSPPFRPPIS